MNEMKTYRALQAHVSNVNRLVSSLYNGGITAGEALAEAEKEIEIVAEKLKGIKAESA
jgi:hypothetical protein